MIDNQIEKNCSQCVTLAKTLDKVRGESIAHRSGLQIGFSPDEKNSWSIMLIDQPNSITYGTSFNEVIEKMKKTLKDLTEKELLLRKDQVDILTKSLSSLQTN